MEPIKVLFTISFIKIRCYYYPFNPLWLSLSASSSRDRKKTVWRDGMIICTRRAALHNELVVHYNLHKKMCKSEFAEMKKPNTAGRNTSVHHTQERTFYTCQPGFSYSEWGGGGLTRFSNPDINTWAWKWVTWGTLLIRRSHILNVMSLRLSDRNLQQSNSPTAALSKAESRHTHLTHPDIYWI